MANELNFYGNLAQTGFTVIARVYDSAGVQVGADVSCAEAGVLAIYTGDMVTAPLGQYGVRFFDDTDTLLSQGVINWDGTGECELNLDVEVSTREAEADALTRATTNQTEHDATQTALAGAPTPLTAAQVNAEVDTALSDYDGATGTELTATQVAIAALIMAQNDISIADVQTAIGNVEPIDSNIISVTGTSVTDVTDFQGAGASGFATPADIAAAQAAIIAEVDANEVKIDTVITDVGNLNDFDPAADTVARVTLVDTTTANTDMRGTDGANTVAPLTAAQVNTEVDTALTDYDGPTKAELDTAQAAIISEIDANETKIDTAIADIASIPTGIAPSAADIYAEFTSGTNEDVFKADVSSVATSAEISALNNLSSADITAAVPSAAQIEAALLNEGDGQQLIDAIVQAIGNTNLSEVSLVAAIRADIERSGGLIDLIPTLSEIEASAVIAKASDIAGLNDITAADVVTAMQVVATDFQATGFATPANVSTSEANVISEIDANEAKIDSIITSVSAIPTSDSVADLAPVLAAVAALNNLSSADLSAAFGSYDSPTKTELDTAEANIIAAVGSSSVTPENIWEYLQADPTTSGSMKEAVEIILKRANLIPAAL